MSALYNERYREVYSEKMSRDWGIGITILRDRKPRI